MKWTLRKLTNGQYRVRFNGGIPVDFLTRGGALEYINLRVLRAMGV